jgi:hypothetical protein
VPDGVDTPVEAEKPASASPPLDRIPRKSEPPQLPSSNDAVLKPGQLRHQLVSWTI